MNDTLVPHALASEISGALAVILCCIVLVTVTVMAFQALRRGSQGDNNQQALDLGHRILEAFEGDYTMAAAEVLRIRSENRMIRRIADAEARRFSRMPAGASTTHMPRRDVH